MTTRDSDCREPLGGNRHFRALWAGETISQVGSQVTMVALPLVAITTLDAGPFSVGILTALATVGFLLVGIPAGVVLDRHSRRSILLLTNLARGITTLSVPVAWAVHWLTLPHLYIAVFINSVATVFFDGAYQSFLPSLVSPAELVSGNARLQASQAAAQAGGPTIGGGLVQLVGPPFAMIVDSASFFTSAIMIRSIKIAEPSRTETASPIRLADGIRFLARNAMLWRITVCTSTGNLFNGTWSAIAFLFLTHDIHVRPVLLGLILSFGALSGVLGAVLAPRLSRRCSPGRLCRLTLLCTMPCGLLMPLASSGWGILVYTLGAFALSFGFVIYNVAQTSLRQTITPEHMLGRVTATTRFFAWGALSVGSVVGGVLGETLGLRGALTVAAVGLLVTPLWILVPRLPDLDVVENQAEARA